MLKKHTHLHRTLNLKIKRSDIRSLENQRPCPFQNWNITKIIIYSSSLYQHFLKMSLTFVHNLLNYFAWTLWDAKLGLVQVRITWNCNAAHTHKVSQSAMKVSPIVKKRQSHTLWPHWGTPSVTSEVTCHMAAISWDIKDFLYRDRKLTIVVKICTKEQFSIFNPSAECWVKLMMV